MGKDLFSLLNHDLRGAMSMLAVSTKMLEKEKNTDKLSEKEQKLLSVIRSNVRHLEDGIQNLIGAVQIETGKMRFEPKVLEVSEELAYVAQRYRMAADEKEITMEILSPPLLTLVSADRDWFLLLVSNLISGLLKNTGHRGIISIGAEALDNDVRFFVTGREQAEDGKQRRVDLRALEERDSALLFARRLAVSQGIDLEINSASGKSEVSFSLPRGSSELAANL